MTFFLALVAFVLLVSSLLARMLVDSQQESNRATNTEGHTNSQVSKSARSGLT